MSVIARFMLDAAAGSSGGGATAYFFSVIGNTSLGLYSSSAATNRMCVSSADSGIIVTGYDQSYTTSGRRGHVYKLSGDGSEVLWERDWADTSDNGGFLMSAVADDPSTGYVVYAGYAQNASNSYRYHTRGILDPSDGTIVATDNEITYDPTNLDLGTASSICTGFNNGSGFVVGSTIQDPGVIDYGHFAVYSMSTGAHAVSRSIRTGNAGSSSNPCLCLGTKYWQGYRTTVGGNYVWNIAQMTATSSSTFTNDWSRSYYPNSYTHEIRGIDGNTNYSSDYIYVTGFVQGPTGSAGVRAPVVMKLDVSGATPSIVWSRYATNNNSSSYNYVSSCVDDDGNVYTHWWDTALSYTTNITKWDASGTFQWNRTFNFGGGSITSFLPGCLIFDPADPALVFQGYMNDSSLNSQVSHFVVRYPLDGSITGTFGTLTISSSTPTNGSVSMSSPSAGFSLTNDSTSGAAFSSTATSTQESVQNTELLS